MKNRSSLFGQLALMVRIPCFKVLVSGAIRNAVLLNRWLLAVVLGLGLSQAYAVDLTPAFDAANQLYEKGKYAEAAAAYETIIQSRQVSPALYFNLANAWFKAGQVGRSIINYRYAEALAPRDPDILANLQFARDAVGGGAISPRAWVQRGLGWLSLNEWTALTGTVLWAWLGLVAVGRWREEWRSALRKWTIATGVSLAVLTVAFGVVLRDRFGVSRAVVAVPEAVVRHGPLPESQTAYLLHDGAEVVIADEQKGWLQVRDTAGRLGWLRQEQILRVYPTRRR